MTPHACPVCYGQGTVSKPPHVAGDQLTWTDNRTDTYPCRACKGTGVVWEPAAAVALHMFAHDLRES